MKRHKLFQLAYDVHTWRMIPRLVINLEGDMCTSDIIPLKQYILNEKGGPKEDACIMSYQSQGVSVWEGAEVVHLQAGVQYIKSSYKMVGARGLVHLEELAVGANSTMMPNQMLVYINSKKKRETKLSKDLSKLMMELLGSVKERHWATTLLDSPESAQVFANIVLCKPLAGGYAKHDCKIIGTYCIGVYDDVVVVVFLGTLHAKIYVKYDVDVSVGESSPNPTTSNPKRCNRRRSKQPFILEESPVDTIADQRTVAKLLRTPTEGYAEAIVVPLILVEHFELKHSLINMMTSDQFFGLEKDNPHDHIRWFNKITSTIKYKDVPNSAIKLILFPFSLARAARRWLKKEPPRSILTWEDLAWDRYKDLLHACPHHGFIEPHQLDAFYNALNLADQDSLNSAAGGNLLERCTQDVLTIIENKSKVCNSRNKLIVSQVKSSDGNSSSSFSEISKLTHAVNQQTSAVTTAMTTILKQFQANPPPAFVKAVEEICVTCSGVHPYYQCLAADGNTVLKFRDNIQGYVSAATVNYNQGNFGYRPPGVANQIRPSGFAQPNVKNNQNRFSQPQRYNRENNFNQDSSYQAPIQQNQVVPLTFFQMNTATTSGSGPLPSNTIANPKGELKAITTRSGLVLDGPFVSMPPPFINLEEDEGVEETLTDTELAVILKKLPEKLGDPGKFLILCGFSELKGKALADLGVSINLMPLSVWKKLDLPELISTRMTLELANRAICTQAGIARDVFVLVGKFTFPTDFVIVDYGSDPRVPLILGRPFAFIDVHGEEMILYDGDERLTLNMRHATSSYSNQHQQESINMINIYNDSCEDYLEDLFATNHLSGNPTFSSHTDVTSPEVINPLSGSTTSSSSNHLLEEFADELALITLLPGNDDLPFDIKFNLREIEYLLNHDPTKEMDSILKNSFDKDNLADPNNNLVDTIPKMFTDEHTLDYSYPPLYDEYDDDLVELEFDNDDAYNDPFDSKEEKIKESKLLIDELDPPRSSDLLPSLEYDSFLFEDFLEVDALPSTDNEDKVFNPGILIHENLFEVTAQVTTDKNVKKISMSHASLILEDFDPPLYELPFHKEVPRSETLLSFSFENEEKVFKTGILTYKGVHTSLLLTKNLRNEISNFQQQFDESFHEAWDRYKDLLRACPHHGFTELHQLDTFYNVLNPADQDSLNSAAGGNLLERRTQDVLTIIENKSKVRNSRNKSIVSQVKSSDGNSSSSSEIAKLTHAVNQQTSSVATAMSAILKQFQATPPLDSVKVFEEICVTCGSAHPYYQCLAADGNLFPKFQDIFKDTFQQPRLTTIRVISVIALRAWLIKFDHRVLLNRMFKIIKTGLANLKDIIEETVSIKIHLIKLQFKKIKPLPSNAIANPKGELKAITTRSGLVLDGPSIPMPLPFINSEEDEGVEETLTDPKLDKYTIKIPPPLVQKAKPHSQRNYVVHQRDPLHPNIPYPLRMYKQKQQDKDKIQIHKFCQMFKQLHINITLTDALILILKYQKMLKALLSNNEKLLELANTPLNENCSAVILKKLPEKLGDPRKFLIPCGFSELKCKALADLGASINLTPLSVWKKLGLPKLISTRMSLELANRVFCTPAGIARDVFVLVKNFTFLADFVIVDYESDPRDPLILGRPFLWTPRALINVHGEEMTLRNGDERLTLNMIHDLTLAPLGLFC
uniref:Reverse transcriptase domain-containing protein n=1 Tax=Tanacetum cinerariifolium TaxID=118510 RepID=A0A6L2K640_TANCI|nr:reverse transcriptase domain-containing protein [Tanacetum cinerariifolium]